MTETDIVFADLHPKLDPHNFQLDEESDGEEEDPKLNGGFNKGFDAVERKTSSCCVPPAWTLS